MAKRKGLLFFVTTILIPLGVCFGTNQCDQSSLVKEPKQSELLSHDSGSTESSPREDSNGKRSEGVTLECTNPLMSEAATPEQLRKHLEEILSPYDLQRLNKFLTGKDILPQLLASVQLGVKDLETAEKKFGSASEILSLLGEKTVHQALFKIKSLYMEAETILYETSGACNSSALPKETADNLVELQTACSSLMKHLNPNFKTQRQALNP